MKTIDFSKKLIRSGMKTTSESSAQVKLNSSYNSFKLNKLAMRSLGVEEGDKVVMFDAYEVGEDISQEERYLICKGGFTDEAGIVQGAVIGKGTCAFNYSHIYGTLLTNDVKVEGASKDDLLKAGLVVNTAASTVATKTMVAELVPYGEGEAIEILPGIYEKLFVLTDFTWIDHVVEVDTIVVGVGYTSDA